MLERRMALDVVGTRRPGEVVNVFLDVMMRGRAVRLVAPVALNARRTHVPPSRDRKPRVIGSEVSEEFGGEVKLMAIPSAVLEYTDLRKPLSDKEEISDCAGAREGSRHVRRPCDLHVDGLARCDRAIQRHFRDGAI